MPFEFVLSFIRRLFNFHLLSILHIRRAFSFEAVIHWLVHDLISSSARTLCYVDSKANTLVLKWKISVFLSSKIFFDDDMTIKSWCCGPSSIATPRLWSPIIILRRIAINSFSASVYSSDDASSINEWIPCAGSLLLLLLEIGMFVIFNPVVVLHILKAHIFSINGNPFTALVFLSTDLFILSLEEPTCYGRWPTHYDSASRLRNDLVMFKDVATVV